MRRHTDTRGTQQWGIAFGRTSQEHQVLGAPHTVKLEHIPYSSNPSSVFEKLEGDCEYAYLLESVEGPERLAKFSFIGFNPRLVVSARDGKATTINMMDENEEHQETNDPLDIVRKEIQRNHLSHDQFRLVGGAVGYISYDAARYCERLPSTTSDDQGYPDLELAFFDDGIVFDHINQEAYYYSQDSSQLEEFQTRVQEAAVDSQPLRYATPTSNLTKDAFEESVSNAKEYIRSGDIFQVVLSKRYSFDFTGSLLHFYRVLRSINPSPYMYFLKMGERQVVGSSPEMLVRVERGTVETYPIAGTRPRTGEPMKDRMLAEELLSDEKERAEHVMLVDLARNDIGRIAEFASVQIPEFMTVHQYSHVQHIVSRVVGKMRSDMDCFDALEVMLPAGTVSGAPKVRAMEIIEDLEPTRRGPYAGAVGYFAYNGNADFAITIRTLTANRDRASIQVGAGIVADSDPEREWFETEQKAAALMKALAEAGEEI